MGVRAVSTPFALTAEWGSVGAYRLWDWVLASSAQCFYQCVDEGKEEHQTCSHRECAKGAHSQTAANRHAAHLLVAGGGDARFGLLLPTVLVLRLPEPSLTKEALMQFQLITSLLPAHTALNMQPVDVDCDVLNVFRRNPSPGNIQRRRQKLTKGCWTPCVVKDN